MQISKSEKKKLMPPPPLQNPDYAPDAPPQTPQS